MSLILEDYLEDAYFFEPQIFNKYEPTGKESVKFGFLQKVAVSHFCNSRYDVLQGKGEDVLAEKSIELTENELTNRIFTIIDRTRIHTGTLESNDSEYTGGGNFLKENGRFTVYILSDGFGKKFKALSDHLTLIT